MDNYLVKATLSKAQDGVILLGYHQSTQTSFAIKRIAVSRSTRTSLIMEMNAYKAMQTTTSVAGSQHVLHLHHAFQEKQHQHLVLDYCPNGELYNLLKSLPNQQCNPTLAQSYFYQIATGVAYIHAHGLAHRDLSLENIFVTAEGMLKIGDFGLAMPLHATSTTAVGKLYYMAPEMHGSYEASKVDVWSLGILLWMLLTGVPLVERSNDEDATFVYLKKHGIRVLIRAWQLDIPEDAIAMLESLLIVNPLERPDMTIVIKHSYLQAP